MLDATAAPHGSERAAAEALRDWCRGRWPLVDWTVQAYGDGGANLIGRHRSRAGGARNPAPGTGVLLYSHLDTSLDGGPQDVAVTGRTDPVGPLRIQKDGTVDGFGLGVARAPAAAALLGFAERAAPDAGATLLLAGSGTHRLDPGTTGPAGPFGSFGSAGVAAYLAAEPRPAAAVVAKAGPAGVLWSEPGAAYLQVRLSGRQGAVLARAAARPSGGVIAHAGLIIAAIEAWRLRHLAGREDPSGQIGAEVGIGAIRAGLWEKPDLLPGALELGLYLVTMPGDDVDELARELAESLRSEVALGPLSGCDLAVRARLVHAAAATDEQAPIVRRAVATWTAAFGVPVPIRGWTGSTDGVVLRGHGIDTVRLGPQISADAGDARRDVVSLDRLAAWPAIYAALLQRLPNPGTEGSCAPVCPA